MNYFAHGRRFVDDPYLLAGTAVPDWLSVVDRRVRVRSRYAEPFVCDADPRIAAVARGIVQHHGDDARFHQTPAFAEISLGLCRRLRELLEPEDGMRPYFVGHVLVEMLLDAALVARDAERLERYYAAIQTLDAEVVQDAVNRIAPRSTDRLRPFLPLFVRERFLWDYADDARLLARLNQVLRRVKLPPLCNKVLELLPSARRQVSRRADELLAACELSPAELNHSWEAPR